jgi:hypothetical protein
MNTIKSDSKFKEMFLILKSGIIGALALTGICIFLFLIGFAVRGEFISYFYQKTFARCSFEGLLIATSGLGFVLGMIARRRLTLKSEIILIATFSVPLIIGAWLLHAYAIRVAIPHTMKLADCSNSVVNIRLKVPQGHGYCLDLITPEIQAMPNGTVISSCKFSGRVRISNGTSLVADFPIGSDKSWLTGSEFVLTGVGLQNTNVPPLSQFIQAQRDYDIEITFDSSPPPSSSIWLYWLQSRGDTEK